MNALTVLVAAQVLSVANSNLIAVALPPLSRDLGASGVQQLWIVDTYVLVFAALLVTGGVLADRYGRRLALLAGLTTFAAGSLACALVRDPGLLIAARVVQALGPPLILPASLSIVTATFADPTERARAIGIWGAGSGFGIAVGPLLGGLIVSGLGWRWAFGLSGLAAVGLAAAALVLIPFDRPAAPTRRFDHLGAVLVTAVLAAIVFGLIEGPERGWTSPIVAAAFATAVAFAATFVLAEGRHPAPLVDLGLLRQPVFAAANLAAATVMFVMLATSVYLSQFLQAFHGSTPLEAGLALLPVGGATAFFAGVSGRLTEHASARTLIALGLLCAAVGAFLLSRIGPDDGPASLWPALFALGAGAGIALPATTATAVAAVPLTRTGMASAIHNAGRQVGATLGVAVLGSIVTAHAVGGTATGYTHGLAVAQLVATLAQLATAIVSTVALRTVRWRRA